MTSRHCCCVCFMYTVVVAHWSVPPTCIKCDSGSLICKSLSPFTAAAQWTASVDSQTFLNSFMLITCFLNFLSWSRVIDWPGYQAACEYSTDLSAYLTHHQCVITGHKVWSLNTYLRGSVDAFEMQCYKNSMIISYREPVMTEEVLNVLHKTVHMSHHTSREQDIM